MKKIILLLTTLVIVSCTEQHRVRQFGGTMEVKLPKGEKLVTATWKEIDLFYLTEPMEENYQPKIKKFYEDSSFGIMESEIHFIETR